MVPMYRVRVMRALPSLLVLDGVELDALEEGVVGANFAALESARGDALNTVHVKTTIKNVQNVPVINDQPEEEGEGGGGEGQGEGEAQGQEEGQQEVQGVACAVPRHRARQQRDVLPAALHHPRRDRRHRRQRGLGRVRRHGRQREGERRVWGAGVAQGAATQRQ
jgi:hypothetical protein